MTQREVADRTGIALGTLRNWEQGKNEPDIETIIMLADLYETSTDELLGSKFGIAPRPTTTHPMPVIGRIAAGAEREAIRSTDTYHDTTDNIWKRHRKAFWLVVAGNSMNRLFPEGTLVLVDPTIEVRDGDVAAVMVNGDDATLKRVYFEDGGVRLHPESHDPEYRDRFIDASDPDAPAFKPIGKVVTYTAPDGWRA